jgi:F-type H+-transporting ATPase subunit b
VLTAVALAAESTNPILPATNEIIWGTVAFVLLLVLLARSGVFKQISKALTERTERIEGNIERAERIPREAEETLEKYRALLAEARDEANRIREDARRDAEQARRDLLERAEADANRIVQRAQEEIQAERDRAVAQVRREVGSLALTLAGRVIGETMDDDRQLRLVDRYIEQLQGEENGAQG